MEKIFLILITLQSAKSNAIGRNVWFKGLYFTIHGLLTVNLFSKGESLILRDDLFSGKKNR